MIGLGWKIYRIEGCYMGVKETYYCDRCGKEVEDEDCLYEIDYFFIEGRTRIPARKFICHNCYCGLREVVNSVRCCYLQVPLYKQPS